MNNSQVAKLNEDNEDLFLFADEESDEDFDSSRKTGWKLLIVDDDEAIHASTRFVLADYEYDGMAVELLHAYSSKQARELLAEHTDTGSIGFILNKPLDFSLKELIPELDYDFEYFDY